MNPAARKQEQHAEKAPQSLREKARLDDMVDEASRESFPASDPPAWTGGHTNKEDESNNDAEDSHS